MGKMSKVALFSGRIFLGGIFVYSGYVKLTEPIENFIHSMSQYEIIPHVLYPVIAMTVPWVEFLFGAFLILGYAPRIASAVLALWSLGFLGVIFLSGSLWTSPERNCGCFGEGGLHVSTGTIFVVDFVNVFLGFRLSTIKGHPLSLDQLLRRKPS